MGFFDKLKRIFKRKNDEEVMREILGDKEVKPLDTKQTAPKQEEPYVPLDLPEGEIVSFDDEVLDTESRASIDKFKHNLEVLVNQAKEKGKVDKFMIIREDDFFPEDWQWRVLSKETNLEKVSTRLSYEVRKAYALEQSGIEPYRDFMGTKIPNATYDETLKAMSKVDKTIGSVLMPSRFRSTKHFTVNTPLGVTGDYNSVSDNRDYIIMDNMDAFFASGYGYSVSYHDAYLDVSHEGLPISPDAVVLINDEKYDRIMSDPKRASELAQRRVVRFKGDEVVAINMILTEVGALPPRVGARYIQYDRETLDILDDSIKALAEEHEMFFDKSHAGQLIENGGHFSNYYDDKNRDHIGAEQQFINYLREKFPEAKDLFPEDMSFTESNSQDIVERLGTTDLLDAINEYNQKETERIAESLESYKQDRAAITPEIHEKFVSTIALINEFYRHGDPGYDSYEARAQTEETIRKFIQSGTVVEQLEAGEAVWEIMQERDVDKGKEDSTINMEQFVRNAVTRGIAKEQVVTVDSVESKDTKEVQKEGETIDDK